MNDVRVALCLYGTMRGPNNCLPTVYENIIKVWNTDVIVCINKCYEDDFERVDILRKLGAKIVIEDIQTQPDVYEVFPHSFYNKFLPAAREFASGKNASIINFLAPIIGTHSSLHTRLNWYKLSNLLESQLDNYDYFILTRPDHFYMFPMFDKSFLNKNQIINYSEHSFTVSNLGGVNADFIVISSQFVLQWLRSSIEYLINEPLQDILLEELSKADSCNSEAYTALIVKLCNFELKPMSINSFISGDSENELTSMIPVKYDGEYYYKYETNYLPCKENYNLWQNGYRWKNSADKIYLTLD